MSRRSRRYRARFAATVQIAGVDHTLVCTTRDISSDGCFLDTAEQIASGVSLVLSVMDNAQGEVVQVTGVIARCVPADHSGQGRGIGVMLHDPPEAWADMVDRYQQPTSELAPNQRLSILVVGEQRRRRGALALYVTSGWDVRFAIDQDTAEEALQGIELDAVIAERELSDDSWRAILEAARRIQPGAQRIVRCPLRGQTPPPRGDLPALVHRVVDLDSGLDALLDALTSSSSTPVSRR
jgi:PilZ domain